MKHLVSLKLFEGSVLESLASSDTSDIEIRKLELELELRKFDAQKERELRELEFKERELREREKEREVQIEKQRLDHELEMKKLEMKDKLGCSHPIPSSSVKFDVSKYIKLVPPFHEADVDKYFLHFEKVAQNLEWPKKHWPMLLRSVLVGKARKIYTQLSVEQALDYDSVKQLILKGYELVPEAYRQKFRNQEKGSSETYVEFARTKEQLFDRWCSSQEINNYDRLRELILVREFKRCIPSSVRTFIDEQNIVSTVTVHPVNVVTSDPDEVVSSCSENFNLPGTAKLMNSDILQDLDSKLSHLLPSQRQDLEHLLQEFEHLFPDVPTRTDKIYHDVDVGDATPVKQHPYRLNPAKQKYLHEEIVVIVVTGGLKGCRRRAIVLGYCSQI